jgi:hypothetical protein
VKRQERKENLNSDNQIFANINMTTNYLSQHKKTRHMGM